MIEAGRLKERLAARQLSQSALARRVGVSQQTIAKLLSGKPSGTRHLHRIARALGTTPDYLSGEIDDPDEGAPPPVPEPRLQLLSLKVALPNVDLLEQAFAGVLAASRKMDEAALARELAERLPTLLAVASRPLLDIDAGDAAPAAAETTPSDRREPRRARSR